MNKKGFISTSMVYSFFLVFLLLLLFIVNELINNRLLLNNVKEAVKSDISDTTFARYLINRAEDISLVYHGTNLAGGANDGSYRFVGSNPNNYVCFGSDAASCPANNLYRIIGIYNNEIKLIKNTSITTMPLVGYATNNYINMDIYPYLNEDFLTTLGDYQNYIADTLWYINGIPASSINDYPIAIYNNELGSNQDLSISITAKIGLMYASDYAYATDTTYYNSVVVGTNNWLRNGSNTWTISRLNSTTGDFFIVNSAGRIQSRPVTNSFQVRPVFYLNSSVTLATGDGTFSNPYRIEVAK